MKQNKGNILSIEGEKLKEIELPNNFSREIREDIIAKVLEAKKNKQPYSPSPVAGKQHAAKGKIKHRRHVWRSGYGRGMSRVPRKIFSQKGLNFNWVAAEVPQARGGMRAHPPKILSMLNKKKITKKELNLAFNSAISATANKKSITKRYESLDGKEIKDLPLIVEGKIISLKTKELISSLKKILGEKLFKIALKNKSVRSGKGKLRGRKYKSNAGLLLVTGENEKIKTKKIDVKNMKNLSVVDLAKGSPGRLVLYTEKAIRGLNEKFTNSSKRSQIKSLVGKIK